MARDIPIQTLQCCTCGRETKGRQWYNRDRGFGLCTECANENSDSYNYDMAGKRGYHFDIKENQ